MKNHLGRRALLTLTLASALLTVRLDRCTAAELNGNSSDLPPKVLLETPTAQDHALATHFSELLKQLDQPDGIAREVANNARSNNAERLVKMMQANDAVDAKYLRHARGLLGWLTPQLEAAAELMAPTPFPVAQKRGTIVIDGKLDEKAWTRAAETTLKFEGANAADVPATRAKLLWDEKYFYIGYTVPDANIVAPEMKRDNNVWDYDCVELFLLPHKRFGLYWELEFGATGSIVDFLGYKNPDFWGSDLRKDETVNGLLVGRALRRTANDESDRDEGYTVEVAVPWDQVPGMANGPRRGDTIFALLGWIDRETAGDSKSSARAQVPYVGWFHNIWCYQPLVFSSNNKLPKPR
jgi:hypothetical protein